MKLSSTALLALAISSVTASAYAETQSQAFTPVTVNPPCQATCRPC